MQLRRGVLGLCLVFGCAAPQRTERQQITVAYRFQCEPAEARVTVDEVDQGACRVWQEQYLGLGNGTHRLRVEAPGYLPYEQELTLSGRRETITVRLRPRPE